MNHCTFSFLLALSFTFFLQACQSDQPTAETPKHDSIWDEVLNEDKRNRVPIGPPQIDSALIDTTAPVSKAEKPKIKPPYIKFETPTYRFDTINSGDIVNYEFKFSNSGDRPLEITKVNASCGCTTPSWPFLPFSKGESGSIKARFDSKGKSGKQETTITVNSNAENGEVKLKMLGFVKAAE